MSRLEAIKSARSLNDVLDVVRGISAEHRSCSATIKRIVASLSAGIITIDHRGGDSNAPAAREATYKAPNSKELQKHVDVIYRMYDGIKELDSALALVKQQFAGSKKQPAALKAITDLRKEIADSINDAFDALNEIAHNHMPDGLDKLVTGIRSNIISTVKPSSYDDVQQDLFVVPDPKDKTLLQFCAYIIFEGLTNKSGYKYDKYHVVVTCLINKQGDSHYYINSFPDFKKPGSYPLGKEVRDLKDAKLRVSMLLAHNDFLTDHAKQVLPMTDNDVQTIGLHRLPNVHSASVKGDELIVQLNESISDADRTTAVKDVLALLSRVAGIKKSGQVFSYKFGKIGKYPSIKFLLVPNVERKADRHFNVDTLDELSEALGLTEHQKTAVRFALQH
jgi:hypothetical protein